MKTSLKLICSATIMVAATLPAFADSMTKGETMMIMSDGSMTSMPAPATMDPKAQAAMMKMFKPMTKCMVMMMGSDGKMYSMTTTDAKCTSMGKM